MNAPPWQATDVELQLRGGALVIPHLTTRHTLLSHSLLFPAPIIQLVQLDYRDSNSASRSTAPVIVRPLDTAYSGHSASRLSLVWNAVGCACLLSAGSINIHHYSDNAQNLKHYHHIRQCPERVNLGMLAACSPIGLLHHRRHLGRCICAIGRGGRH